MELAKAPSWRPHGREFSQLWMVTHDLRCCCPNLMTLVLVLALLLNSSDFLRAELEITRTYPPLPIAFHYLTFLLNTDSQDQPSQDSLACFRFFFYFLLRLICCSMVRVVFVAVLLFAV